jgi:hypothetical protein
MERININLLTSKNNNDEMCKAGELSINTMTSKKTKESYISQIDNLLKERKNRRKRLLTEYDKLFELCFQRILTADKMNITEICFDIPSHILGCNEYIVSECIDFLENKLRSLDIDTLRITNNSLFISWLFIELNKEMREKNN